MMEHPYKSERDQAFWKRAFEPGWEKVRPADGTPLINRGEKIASAGSCFAANIVPYLENAGFDYIRRDVPPPLFADVAGDNFNYSRFSAAYGNIYTVRQAVQLLRRALGLFRPWEDRWLVDDDVIIDPFRPGLKYPATSNREFDLLTDQHLSNVIDVVRQADVFVFTLGLTEAWVSSADGAVFPACPGTIAGSFDASRHVFHNFTVREVVQDLQDLVDLARELRPSIRFILTVSPVPLVATASGKHVLIANTYSKSVLRVAASEVSLLKTNVAYFPAYEIVTGPQAPFEFFENDRREPSAKAIETVMSAFLSRCEVSSAIDSSPNQPIVNKTQNPITMSAKNDLAGHLSSLIVHAQCEEEAAGL